MSAWEARAVRFAAISAKLKPSWGSRLARISHRLVKPDCFWCGGEDFIHALSCTHRPAGNSRIAFGNAVIRAELRHRARVGLKALIGELRSQLVFVDGRWVKP